MELRVNCFFEYGIEREERETECCCVGVIIPRALEVWPLNTP